MSYVVGKNIKCKKVSIPNSEITNETCKSLKSSLVFIDSIGEKYKNISTMLSSYKERSDATRAIIDDLIEEYKLHFSLYVLQHVLSLDPDKIDHNQWRYFGNMMYNINRELFSMCELYYDSIDLEKANVKDMSDHESDNDMNTIIAKINDRDLSRIIRRFVKILSQIINISHSSDSNTTIADDIIDFKRTLNDRAIMLIKLHFAAGVPNELSEMTRHIHE